MGGFDCCFLGVLACFISMMIVFILDEWVFVVIEDDEETFYFYFYKLQLLRVLLFLLVVPGKLLFLFPLLLFLFWFQVSIPDILYYILKLEVGNSFSSPPSIFGKCSSSNVTFLYKLVGSVEVSPHSCAKLSLLINFLFFSLYFRLPLPIF